MADKKSNQEYYSKVPQVTVFFWIIKVLCTTVGETASDFLNVNMGFGLVGTTILSGILLAIVLTMQFKSERYTPWIYWLTVVLVSVFGTLVTDILTDALGVPLEFSTIFFTITLMLTFYFWYKSERTLSIHSIHTKKPETFYWLAILSTFALGTATGDLMSEGLGLGYLNTGLIVIGIIIVVFIAWYNGLDSVLSFWIAYIMTRPLGASMGDFLSQPKENGGLGLGASSTSLIFLTLIAITVLYLTKTKKDLTAQTTIQQKNPDKPHDVKKQTIIVLLIFLVGSVGGYKFRYNQLATQAVAENSSFDLSPYAKLEKELLEMVNNDDFNSAKTHSIDLETAWDTDAARLKAIDKNRWKEVDHSIDLVFKQIRARTPDKNATIDAINNSLALMK